MAGPARLPRPTLRAGALAAVTVLLVVLFAATGATGLLPVADLTGLPLVLGASVAWERGGRGPGCAGTEARVVPEVLPAGRGAAYVVALPDPVAGTDLPPVWIENPRAAVRRMGRSALKGVGPVVGPGVGTGGAWRRRSRALGARGRAMARRAGAPGMALCIRLVPVGATTPRGAQVGLRGGPVTVDMGRPRRGVFEVGPRRLWTFDPLGLFGVPVATTGPQRFVVHPRIVVPRSDMASVPGGATSGDGPGPLPTASQGPAAPPEPGSPGDAAGELHGLRPYVAGDRLNLVSWPALARTGRILVREFLPEEGHPLVVVVDDRPGVHRRDAFEDALSAAAGLVEDASRRGVGLVLAALSGGGIEVPPTGEGMAAALSYLATFEPRLPAALGSPLARGRTPPGGGVIVTTTAAAGSLDAMGPGHARRIVVG